MSARDELPYLNMGIITIVFDRDTNETTVNYEDDFNYLEAMSLLQIAKTLIEESPNEGEEDEDEDDDVDL